MADAHLIASATLAGALAALLLVLRVRRWTRSRRARRRAAHAIAGERAAERLLTGAGFRVTDRQAPHRWQIAVDGDTVTAGLRCDYLVERDGARRGAERWVAEIKTGADAPRLDNPATRRQLLEYQVAYGAAGVVLVDADAGTLREIRFDLALAPASAPAPSRLGWLAAGVALGGALTAAAGLLS